MVVDDLFILLSLLSLLILLQCQVNLHSVDVVCCGVCVQMWNQARTVPEQPIDQKTCSVCTAHTKNPHTQHWHRADPARTNPGTHQHQLLLHTGVHQDHSSHIHWAAWGTREDLPETLPVEATTFCKSLGLLKTLCLVPDTVALIQVGYTPEGCPSFYFPIFKERYYLITPEHLVLPQGLFVHNSGLENNIF